MTEARSEGVAWVATNDDKCFFCEAEYPGYALKDKDGDFKAACWDCAKEGSKAVS